MSSSSAQNNQPKYSDRAEVKNTDMPDFMVKTAIDCAIKAIDIEKNSVQKDVATYIKKEFDRVYAPSWNCIVGRNFGSYVTHESLRFIYFFLDSTAILLFKSAAPQVGERFVLG